MRPLYSDKLFSFKNLCIVFFFFSRYAVPDLPFSVPAGITPTELNALLNELIKGIFLTVGQFQSLLYACVGLLSYWNFLLLVPENRTDISTAVDFDFVVCKEFLRQPLNEVLEERNISLEEVVDIEYVEQHPTPEPMDCLMHDDWVSAVEVRNSW